MCHGYVSTALPAQGEQRLQLARQLRVGVRVCRANQPEQPVDDDERRSVLFDRIAELFDAVLWGKIDVQKQVVFHAECLEMSPYLCPLLFEAQVDHKATFAVTPEPGLATSHGTAKTAD